MKILSRIVHRFGLGHNMQEKDEFVHSDVGTDLARQRTDFATNRNYMAAERTLMAWIRTTLSMISFGFTIGKLGQVLHQVKLRGLLGNTRWVSVEEVAYFLVILGTGALIAASVQHWLRLRELRSAGLRRQISIALIVATLLSAVGGFALCALILAS